MMAERDDRCLVELVHPDETRARCILDPQHVQDDSDHQDEHGHRAPVLVHQSTVRGAQRLQDARREEERPRAEYIAELSAADRLDLTRWLLHGSGSAIFGRVTFESVVGGGVLVRVKRYEARPTYERNVT